MHAVAERLARSRRLSNSRAWLALDRLSSRGTCRNGCTKFGATGRPPMNPPVTQLHGHHPIGFLFPRQLSSVRCLCPFQRGVVSSGRENPYKVAATTASVSSSTIFGIGRCWQVSERRVGPAFGKE